MKELLEKILAAGITEDICKYKKKYIRLINAMSMIFSVSATIFIVIFLFLDAPLIALSLVGLKMIFFCVPLLNAYKKYLTARLLLIAALYGGVFFYSSTIGPESLIDIIYVSVLTVPFAICGRDDTYAIYLSLALSVGLYMTFQFTDVFDGLMMNDPPVNIKYPIAVFIFVMPFLVLNQLKNEQTRYEDMLESGNKEISIMNEKLLYSNDKLEHSVTDLQKSMRDREILLREVHHRVKNNMQIINSLLNIQSMYATEDRTKKLLTYSQFRINSMAMVHELLYKSDNFAEINCSEYMKMLINHLLSSMISDDDQISYELNTPDGYMSMDTAVPLGLLVNEIITNSLKHGFRKKKKGIIYLELYKEAGNICVMKIGDNGTGYKGSPKSMPEGSMGMLLINNLIDQLKGKIKKLEAEGTHYEIRFKDLGGVRMEKSA